MVSAKQVSRWRPTCRPQTCWCRGKRFLQMAQYLLDCRQVLDAGESLPRERSECLGHDPHRCAAGPAGLECMSIRGFNICYLISISCNLSATYSSISECLWLRNGLMGQISG